MRDTTRQIRVARLPPLVVADPLPYDIVSACSAAKPNVNLGDGECFVDCARRVFLVWFKTIYDCCSYAVKLVWFEFVLWVVSSSESTPCCGVKILALVCVFPFRFLSASLCFKFSFYVTISLFKTYPAYVSFFIWLLVCSASTFCYSLTFV